MGLIGSIADSLRYHFWMQARGQRGSMSQVNACVDDLLSKHNGLAFGEMHGIYAFPLYLRDRMEDLARQKVTRLYIEMIPRNKKDALDTWQENGSPQDLIDFMNDRSHANAADQWEHYWQMMQAAKKAEIHIIPIDLRHIFGMSSDDTFHPRNDFWMDQIIEDRKNMKPGEKFIVYGGRDHFKYYLLGGYGIASRLHIPALHMETGAPGITMLSQGAKEYLLRLPHAPHQIAHFNGPVVKHHKIPYPD